MAFTGNYVCTSFKVGLLQGKHDFTTHVFKVALYTNAATLNELTSAYSATNEASGTGYTAGGMALSGAAITTSGTTVMLTFTSPAWTTVTLVARGALIYNSTAAGNPTMCVLDFGADKTKTAANLTIVMPPVDVSNALFRL